MTTTSISASPHIPKSASLKPLDQTQVSINAERALLRFNPRWSAYIRKVKLATTQWIREKFELPDAELIPGGRSQADCTIAESLRSGGLQVQEIRVKRTRVSYKDPGSGLITRVMFPAKVRAFVRLYDAGYIPELRQN